MRVVFGNAKEFVAELGLAKASPGIADGILRLTTRTRRHSVASSLNWRETIATCLTEVGDLLTFTGREPRESDNDPVAASIRDAAANLGLEVRGGVFDDGLGDEEA